MPEIYRFTAADTLDPLTGFQYQYITQIRTVTTLHDHEFYELFLIVHGQSEHVCNGARTLLSSGDLFLLRPHDQHCYQPLPGVSCGLYNLAIDRRVFAAACQYLLGTSDTPVFLRNASPASCHLSASEMRSWAAMFQSISLIPPNDAQQRSIRLRSILIHALTQFSRNPQRAVKERIPHWLLDLVSLMRQPEMFREGISAMVAHCPYSREHLYRQFRRYFHQTPSAFLHELQLNYAANLLAHTDTSIPQAALDSGFENLSYFYLLFRQQFSMTPQKYREQTQRDAVGDF